MFDPNPPQAGPYPPPPGYPGYTGPSRPSNNGLAIASLVCSIVGVLAPLFCAVLSLLGVIFGHIALAQIKRSGGWQLGRGVAIAGVIVGYIGLALGVLVGIYLARSPNGS